MAVSNQHLITLELCVDLCRRISMTQINIHHRSSVNTSCTSYPAGPPRHSPFRVVGQNPQCQFPWTRPSLRAPFGPGARARAAVAPENPDPPRKPRGRFECSASAGGSLAPRGLVGRHIEPGCRSELSRGSIAHYTHETVPRHGIRNVTRARVRAAAVIIMIIIATSGSAVNLI